MTTGYDHYIISILMQTRFQSSFIWALRVSTRSCSTQSVKSDIIFDGDTGKVIPIKRDISRISCVKPPFKKCCFTLLKFHFCSILSMFNFCQNLMTLKQSCKKTNDIYLHVLTFPTEFIGVYSKLTFIITFWFSKRDNCDYF